MAAAWLQHDRGTAAAWPRHGRSMPRKLSLANVAAAWPRPGTGKNCFSPSRFVGDGGDGGDGGAQVPDPNPALRAGRMIIFGIDFGIAFWSDLVPTWISKPSQNGVKLAPKSMQVGMLI